MAISPRFIRITDGKVHDVNILDDILPEAGAFYVLECEVSKNVEWARQGPENCGLLALDACPIKHKAPVEHESFVGYFVSLPRPVFRYHW